MTWIELASAFTARQVSLLPSAASPAGAAISKGKELALRGRFSEAVDSFSRAAEIAKRTGDVHSQTEALRRLSACLIRLFDYRAAQAAAESALDLAVSRGDLSNAGAATVNLATVYSQLGDSALAAQEAESATQMLKNSPNKEYLSKALLLYANIAADLTRSHATITPKDVSEIESNYRRAVAVAQEARLPDTEAKIWEEMGEALLLVNRPNEADDPLRRAYQLEQNDHDAGVIGVNREHRAELELQKRHYAAALELIDQALASNNQYFKTTPQYYARHIRGVLLEDLHREGEALIEFRKAIAAAEEWRQGALPGDATSTRTVMVLHEIYRDYAHLAASLSLKNHDPILAREALEALAENRAANLREQITIAYGRKLRIPPHYFDLLEDLQSTQSRVALGEDTAQNRAKLDRIRFELNRIGNESGFEPRGFSRLDEKNPYKNSLRDIQRKLSTREVLLSFSLGKEKSFLWAVTQDQLSVYQLAGEGEIETRAKQFSQAVQNRSDATEPGQRLGQTLFGGLEPKFWRKPEWLMVADGALLDGVPFPSLPDLVTGGKVLIENHSLRFLPSELLLLAPDRAKPQARFVGIGDPIYNIADSRWKNLSLRLVSSPGSDALPRLPGSDREVRAAARESGLPQADILVGSDASVAELQKALADQPSIVHFAVHVISRELSRITGAEQSSKAALVLSLTSGGIPELLTPEAIATLRLPGSLVILSGCSSQRGEILPGAGLMGLSRAWLLAGASAVVVSAWPTPDDSGRFFSSFYGHFEVITSGTLADRAATALQEAQLDMQHGSGYRSSPRFWAAYSIISRE